MNNPVLLVEDNPDEVKLTLRAFIQNSIFRPVVVAKDGVEALDYLFATGPHTGRDVKELPALVLLDLNLPKLDGLEVLRRIRADERTRLLPVVVLTSSTEDEDVLRSYELHANSYMRKSAFFEQFVETVKQIGIYWLLLNEPMHAGGTKS